MVARKCAGGDPSIDLAGDLKRAEVAGPGLRPLARSGCICPAVRNLLERHSAKTKTNGRSWRKAAVPVEELREREHVRNRPTRLLRPIRLRRIADGNKECRDLIIAETKLS
jgi:hypothetical protein